ncbi:hypothetical protein GOP47_0009515 [Adiantum capillus-veneris]|uniref:Major facilitator superfamily (MFS) profile domain-containing protein n=1 Tax=Adiantum capillus-veneris TaxID=13818 RepID=A0A9D4UWR7_ADICA|nr:hypothetical protein GOP47_0009515 [Adiantum capillus-veneris]
MKQNDHAALGVRRNLQRFRPIMCNSCQDCKPQGLLCLFSLCPFNMPIHTLPLNMPLIANEQERQCPLLSECCKQNERRELSIDEVLQECVGELGPSQLLHFSLVSLVWFLQAMLTFAMVFADRIPAWACVEQGSSSCVSTSSICSLDSSQWEWTGGIRTSTVSEWGLICNNSYKVGLVQCLFFAGALLGTGVCGCLSDSFLGRKKVLLSTSCLGSMFGLLSAFAPSFWVYAVVRTATGFSLGGMGTCAFVLATELVGPSKRGPVSMSIFFFYSCGIILLSAIASFSSSWRQLYVISSIPLILYCLLILPWVGESPRWYLAHGKADLALALLKQVASRNGRTIPETIALKAEHFDSPQDVSMVDTPRLLKAAGLLDIFKISSLRKRMLSLLFIWLSNGLSYYGINLNLPNVAAGNIALGLILNAVGEMPASLITSVLLQKYGRRPVLVLALLVSGLSCLGGALVGETKVRMGCGMMAIFGVSAAYNLVFIYTAELFPTEVRNAAVGLAAQAAQVGAITAALAATAARVYGWLPFSVFAVMALTSSFLALYLPETLEKPMHETIQGMLEYKDPV